MVRSSRATLLAGTVIAGAVALLLPPVALVKPTSGLTGSTPTYAAIPATPAEVDPELHV